MLISVGADKSERAAIEPGFQAICRPARIEQILIGLGACSLLTSVVLMPGENT